MGSFCVSIKTKCGETAGVYGGAVVVYAHAHESDHHGAGPQDCRAIRAFVAQRSALQVQLLARRGARCVALVFEGVRAQLERVT